MKEYNELREENSPQYTAAPLEENLFEFHFTVRGVAGTPFERGVYHGRILLPPEYPFKPPSIIFMTPNGRFEVGKKICLSVTGYHPEFWRPAWGIRTVLLAVIGFMPTSGEGAIGALDYTDSERRALATQSLTWSCPVCHTHMSNALPEPSTEVKEEGESKKRDVQESQDMLAQLSFAYEAKKPVSTDSAQPATDSGADHQPAQAEESAQDQSVSEVQVPDREQSRPEMQELKQDEPETNDPPPQLAIIERPAAERPEAERPEAERPEAERPEAERPEAERPAPEQPEAEQAAEPVVMPADPTAAMLQPPPVGATGRPTGPIVPIGRRMQNSPSFLNPWTAAGLEDDAALIERLKMERKVLDSVLAVVLGMLAWLVSNRLSL